MTRKATRRQARKGHKLPSRTEGVPLDAFATETIQLFIRHIVRAGYSKEGVVKTVQAEVRAVPPSVRPTGSGGRADFDDAAHILTLWSKDPDYVEPNGSLRPVPARGPAPSVEALVARVTPPVPFDAAWAQLESTSTLQQVGDRYVPRREAVIHLADPQLLSSHNLRVLNAALHTLEHNFTNGLQEPWFERSAQQTAFPVAMVPTFFEALNEPGMAFLRGVDTRADQIANSASSTEPRCRVLVSYFCTVLPTEAPRPPAQDTGS